MVQSWAMQNELAVARGDAARATTDLELAKAEQHALQRNKEFSSNALEASIAEMQRNTAELLGEKADLQNQLRAVQSEKCQLCAQIDTMQQDLNTSASLRKCTDSKLMSADNRAEKAESELAAVHRANVDMNLRITRLQAENAQLRETNQCAVSSACMQLLLREIEGAARQHEEAVLLRACYACLAMLAAA